MHKRDGFTLIELLVVIAIIAVLMGILMPALQRVRKQAKGVVCFNGLKQIGMGANLYAEDNNSYIPRSAMWGQIDEIKPWFQAFMPYLAQRAIDNDYRNVKIFRCPSYPDKEQTLGYVVNGWGDSVSGSVGGSIYRSKLTECERPGQTIYLADNEDGSWRSIIRSAEDRDLTRNDVFRESHLPMSDNEDIGDGRRVAKARHRDGCNILYLDWHVEFMQAEVMTAQMWLFKKGN